MRILIYSTDAACAKWVKETLLDFGRGMHIHISADATPDILQGKWSYVISLGQDLPQSLQDNPHTTFSLCTRPVEQESLRRQLWHLWRDTLQDLIGNRCSCGMFDTCHCH